MVFLELEEHMPAITAERPASPTEPAAEPSALVASYISRLDIALDGLAPERRLPELQAERLKWIAAYERFCDQVDRGVDPGFGATATDYVICIAEIGKRIGQEER